MRKSKINVIPSPNHKDIKITKVVHTKKLSANIVNN